MKSLFQQEKFHLTLVILLIVCLLTGCQVTEKTNLENVTIILDGEEHVDYQKIDRKSVV